MELRKPTVADVDRIQALMAPHVHTEELLPRTRRQIVERLRDYIVAERSGELVGLTSVSLVDVHLAELGAFVCLQPELRERLVEAALDEARAMGVRSVFVLAPDPEPWLRLGFARVTLEDLPEKRDRQCLRCPRLPRCRQVPLVRYL